MPFSVVKGIQERRNDRRFEAVSGKWPKRRSEKKRPKLLTVPPQNSNFRIRQTVWRFRNETRCMRKKTLSATGSCCHCNKAAVVVYCSSSYLLCVRWAALKRQSQHRLHCSSCASVWRWRKLDASHDFEMRSSCVKRTSAFVVLNKHLLVFQCALCGGFTPCLRSKMFVPCGFVA